MARDLRQTPAYAAYMRSLGWLTTHGVFIKPLPLLPFTLVKIQRPQRLPNLAALKKFRPVFISYEPLLGSPIPKGFRPTTPLLPSKTILLDLRKSLPQLMKEMHPKTRYNIRKFANSNFQFSIIRGDQIGQQDLKDFFEIYRTNSRRQHFWGINFTQLKSLIDCFGKDAYLLIAGKNLGGLLILVYDKIAYYSHNAAGIEGRRRFTPTILTWEAIKLAKKLKCRTFDFEGITDERFPLTKKWTGFSRFKKSFGGKGVKYPGAFSKWIFPTVWQQL